MSISKKNYFSYKKALLFIPGAYCFLCLQMNDKYSYRTNKLLYQIFGFETAHQASLFFLKNIKWYFYMKRDYYSTMSQRINGISFKSPVGLAAGFDPDGSALAGLRAIGAGFTEIGTVTPYPENQKNIHASYSFEDNTTFYNNRFNNSGFDKALKNIKKYRNNSGKGIIGVNIGANVSSDPTNDYLKGVETFYGIANYLSFNISPNSSSEFNELKIPDLKNFIDKVKNFTTNKSSKKDTMIFLKLSPDFNDQECIEISRIIKDSIVDGLILTNGTSFRQNELSDKIKESKGLMGGRYLKDRSNHMIRHFHKLTDGKMILIGVGGIENGKDVFEKIACGASLVQIYTNICHDGLGIFRKLLKELNSFAICEGFNTVKQIIESKKSD